MSRPHRRVRGAFLAAVLLLGGCIDFSKDLGFCRDAGPCRPDAGGSGADGGWDRAYQGALGWCFDGGLCWVHPQPFGEALDAVDGTSPDDLWVAGSAGFVAHFAGRQLD